MSAQNRPIVSRGRASARPNSRNGSKPEVLNGWAPPTFLNGAGPAGRLGYGRVSTGGQQLEPQLDRLTPECERVYTDHGVSGTKGRYERPGLAALLAYARAGDVVVVVKLDRLARSLRELVTLVAELQERGVGLRVLDAPIDTTTAAGMLFFHMVAAFAEFERSLIVERTHDGLAAAREQGRVGGRPRVVTEDKQRVVAAMMAEKPPRSFAAIARAVGVSRLSVARWVKDQEHASE